MFAGISTADQLPRVRYNRNFWLVLFMLSCFAVIVTAVARRRPK